MKLHYNNFIECLILFLAMNFALPVHGQMPNKNLPIIKSASGSHKVIDKKNSPDSFNYLFQAPARPKKELQETYADYGRAGNPIYEKSESDIQPPDRQFVPLHVEGKGKSCQYSSNGQLAVLSTNDLINYLKSTSDYNCHARILFNYELAYSPLIFTNDKIQAVANEILNLAPGFDGTYSNGIYGLICYIHVAQYFEFYYSSTISINSTSLNAIAMATDVLGTNPNVLALNAEASVILEEFLIVLDHPGLRHRQPTLDLMKQIMINMVIDDTWAISPDISWVFGYWRIYYIMFRGFVNNDVDYLNAVANDPEFIELWGSVATDPEIMANPDISSLYQDNAIIELARVASNILFTENVCPYLSEVCEIFPRLHKNWINAVLAINNAGQCIQYDLCEDENAIREELRALVFPNTFNYNDSLLVFKAKFMQEVSDNLYYATRQAEAQFFRLVQTDQPVSGDVNTTLSCIVFESKQVYDDYAYFLYGIPTNNGGMYLEQPAEFYTWDRPETYSLSLEELFRHEFNHYLQGRYLIPGYWGQVPFYDNNRLTWYEEGHAEFICASTAFEGIKLKTSTINTIKYDYPNWPSLADVLNSYYGQAGSIYYPYGNLVWYNWYINDYGKIKTFHDLTRNNDITGFDNLVNSIKNSPTAQTQWQSFLMDVYNDVIPAWEVNTSWINDEDLTVALLDDIQNEFIEITGMSEVAVTLDASSIISRFRISGIITGTEPASNLTDAAIKANEALDTLLVQLKSDQFIKNFDYTVGYLTNVSNPANIPTADFYILGSLRDPSIPDDPVANITSDERILLTGNSVNFESLSTGYIKGYAWEFPGGTPPVSAKINPAITYESEGLYSVSLIVYGKNQTIADTITMENYISVYSPAVEEYCTATNGYDYSWISKVQIEDIDNSTIGFPLEGFTDFSATLVTELIQGSSYPISIDLNYTNSPNRNIAVWIDINKNGSFEDTGEQLLLANPPQLEQLSGATITIPADAPTGITRMRVRANYLGGGNISSCGYDAYMGETEDYSVVIAGGENTLALNVFLEGSFNGINMDTHLKENDLLPLSQPFNTAPWNYPGVESVVAIPSPEIVDWVLLEYRDATNVSLANSESIIGKTAAFLKNDGCVVALDGISPLAFSETVSNHLFVVIRHRNHLSILSQYPVSGSGGVYFYNFTVSADQAFGNNQSELAGGRYGMISGDANADGDINDFDKIEAWNLQAGQKGYLKSDMNLDSQINNLDKNNTWLKNYGKGEQWPE
ncbi:MAG: collagenase [Bacteroidales bacterium]